VTAALKDVRPVNSGCSDLDQHLIGARLWHWPLHKAQVARIAGDYGSHGLG
jgi:hypothetical protein